LWADLLSTSWQAPESVLGTVWPTVTSLRATDCKHSKTPKWWAKYTMRKRLTEKGKTLPDRVNFQLSNGTLLVKIGNFGKEICFPQILAEEFLNDLYHVDLHP